MSLRLFLALIYLVAVPSVAWGRNWRDASGKFSVEAEFVELRGETLRLRKQDGKIIQLPLAKLCDEDRALAQSSARLPNNAGETPKAASVAAAAPISTPTVDLASLDAFLMSKVEYEPSDKTYAEVAAAVRTKLGCNVFLQPRWLATQGLAVDQAIQPPLTSAAGSVPSVGKTWLESLQYVSRGDWRFAGATLELGSSQLEFGLYRLNGPDTKDMDLLRSELQKVSAASWQDSGGVGSIDKIAGFVLVGQKSATQHEIRTRFKGRLQNVPIADPWTLAAPAAEVAAIWKTLQKPVTADFHQQPLERIVADLAKQTGLRIDFSDSASQIGLSRTTPITLRCDGASVGRVLSNINPLMSIAADRVTIDALPPSRTEAKLVFADFDFGFLAAKGGTAKRLDDFSPVVELVSAVQPASWSGVGGPGRLEQRDDWRTLRVSNTLPVLMEIVPIVDGLKRASTGKLPKKAK